MFIDLIFYTGSFLAVGSFALKNIFYLRATSLTAGLLFCTYYILSHAEIKLLVLNVIIILLNVYYIVQMYLNRRQYQVLKRYKRIRKAKKERLKHENAS